MRRCTICPTNVAAAVVVALVLVGCPARFDGQADGTMSTGGECSPGEEGCPCLTGLCQFGLACDVDLDRCVDQGDGGGDAPPPPDTEGEEGGADTGTSDTGTSSGSCVNHCGEGVPDGDGTCFCTPTCAGLGTCCADYDEACPDAPGCTNEECPDDQICSVGTQQCEPVYGHAFDVYVHFEDTSGFCWDTPGACEPDPFFNALLAPNAASCTYTEVVHSSGWLSDTYVASWPAFSYTVNDGDILMFVTSDWDPEDPPGPTIMPTCCLIALQGTDGVAKLRDGEGMCMWEGGLLRTTFVAQ